MNNCQFCGNGNSHTINNPYGEYPDEQFTVCGRCWDTIATLIIKIVPHVFKARVVDGEVLLIPKNCDPQGV